MLINCWAVTATATILEWECLFTPSIFYPSCSNLHFIRLFCSKFWGLKFCPGPRWGSSQRSPRCLGWWGEARCPLPKNPTPALGPLGLRLRPSGLRFRPKLHPLALREKISPPQNKFGSTPLILLSLLLKPAFPEFLQVLSVNKGDTSEIVAGVLQHCS